MRVGVEELQKRLCASYMHNPEIALRRPLAGKLSSLLSGKWKTLAGFIDAAVHEGVPPSIELIYQRVNAAKYDGPANDYISAIEIQDLPEVKSETTIAGYERQLMEFHRQVEAIDIMRSCAAAIDPKKHIADPGVPIADMIERLRKIDASGGSDVNHGEALTEALKDARATRDRRSRGIPDATWGIPAMDSLCPLESGRLYILAATPKCGKTSMAMQAATATAAAGSCVAFASLEMPAREIARVMASRALGLDARAIARGMMNDQQFAEADALAQDWKAKNSIVIRDTRSDTHRCADIAQWARMRKRILGNVGLLVIDYLQLMESSNPHKSEYEVITGNTRTLKLLANQLDLPVLVLSQMNRAGREQRMRDGHKLGQVEPTMNALRGSGSIEQDADAVCFLWSEHEPDGRELCRPVQFKLEASRFCGTGSVDLVFYGPQQTFSIQESDRARKLRTQPHDGEDKFNQ